METNNKACCEALEKVVWCCQWMYDNTSDQSLKDHLKKPIEIARAALAEPPRNCDKMDSDKAICDFRTWMKTHDYRLSAKQAEVVMLTIWWLYDETRKAEVKYG